MKTTAKMGGEGGGGMEEKRQAIHCREKITKKSALTPREHRDLAVGHHTWVKRYLSMIMSFSLIPRGGEFV